MPRIEDYALIGDGETAALVSNRGSIDWLCWPRFDSPACFAALLGTGEHGYWRLAPVSEGAKVTRRYLDETLILETTFQTDAGRVSVTDFMPRKSRASHVIRTVRGLTGRVPMRLEFRARFGYGAMIPWVSQPTRRRSELHAVAGPDALMLRGPVELRHDADLATAEFTVAKGQTVSFTLTHSPSHLRVPRAPDARAAQRETAAYWQTWARQCDYPGRWREAVVRSLITLKALIYEPTGGIVAAPTTSLPEFIGGKRNWDYRICWLRDATFTLLALMNAGYVEEAARWREWLVRALAGAPAQAQIMYGLAGERRLAEWEVKWLPGYENSRPVRCGNAAALQRQFDIYGEVADALHHARLSGLSNTDGAAWEIQRELTKHVCEVWKQPDEGIWEVRGPRQHFTHSKVMAWVAIDRAIKSAKQYGLEGPIAHWCETRERIHADVLAKGYSTKRRSFVQAYGAENLDAATLLIPLVGFLPPEDERVRNTVLAIGRDLMDDGLVMRYHTSQTDDGLPPGEGAFLACSFWYADNLAQQGRQAEARELFEHLLGLRNDVGLLSEQYDPRAQRQLGNFPQAFSHVALVSTGYNLAQRAPAKPAEQRSRNQER